ncbi:MAG TPA: tetratricopeptide repeat protein, partial [bacterium]|nr:tetratricopeptide repeat protein [bacterium]
MRLSRRIVSLLLLGVVPAGLSTTVQAIPEPSELAEARGEERVELLLSIGLARDAEQALRADLEAGRPWARAPLVRMLVRTQRGDEAQELVASWGGPDSLGTEADRFTWGRLLEQQGNWAEAAEAYARSAEIEPLLADLASFRAGLSYFRSGNSARALEFYERAGASARTSSLAARAHWEAATAALASGNAPRALTNLENVPRRSSIDIEDLLTLEAAIHRGLGAEEREARVLRDLVDRVPASDEALAAVDRLRDIGSPTLLDRLAFAEVALRNRHASRAESEIRSVLEELGEGPDPELEGRARLQLGKAMISARQYTAARQELARMPEGAAAEDRAEALLDRARCLWRLDRIEACLTEYDAIAEGNWSATARATAMWEAGREAKDNRLWDEAAARLGEFQQRFPDDDFADDAAWHRGRALTELGRTDEALAAFDLLLSRYPDSRFSGEAAYWLAGLHRTRGERDEECAAFARLLREQPDSYWAERARSRLADEPCPPESTTVASTGVDPFAWLAEQLPGVDADNARRHAQELQGSERFRRATILAQTGLLADAEEELAGLRRALERDSAALLGFAQNAWLIG